MEQTDDTAVVVPAGEASDLTEGELAVVETLRSHPAFGAIDKVQLDRHTLKHLFVQVSDRPASFCEKVATKCERMIEAGYMRPDLSLASGSPARARTDPPPAPPGAGRVAGGRSAWEEELRSELAARVDRRTIRIDPEFDGLIPPLSQDESQRLDESLRAEGCRDRVVVWKGHGIVLDGHHRFRRCTAAGIPFETREVEFQDRAAAKVWILRNQLGRRNLSPYHRTKLALQLEEMLAPEAKERQRAGGGSGPSGRQNSAEPGDTRDKVAEVARVSHDTVSRVKKIDAEGSEELKGEVERGEKSINAAYNEINEANAETPPKAKRLSRKDRDAATADLRERRARAAEGAIRRAFAACQTHDTVRVLYHRLGKVLQTTRHAQDAEVKRLFGRGSAAGSGE